MSFLTPKTHCLTVATVHCRAQAGWLRGRDKPLICRRRSGSSPGKGGLSFRFALVYIFYVLHARRNVTSREAVPRALHEAVEVGTLSLCRPPFFLTSNYSSLPIVYRDEWCLPRPNVCILPYELFFKSLRSAWLPVDPTNRNASGIEPATGPPDSELATMTDLRVFIFGMRLLVLLEEIYRHYRGTSVSLFGMVMAL